MHGDPPSRIELQSIFRAMPQKEGQEFGCVSPPRRGMCGAVRCGMVPSSSRTLGRVSCIIAARLVGSWLVSDVPHIAVVVVSLPASCSRNRFQGWRPRQDARLCYRRCTPSLPAAFLHLPTCYPTGAYFWRRLLPSLLIGSLSNHRLIKKVVEIGHDGVCIEPFRVFICSRPHTSIVFSLLPFVARLG